MTVEDRLNENIELTSPEGSIFTAKWIGDPRTLTKKVGLFNFPKVKGTKGQDLDVTSDTYPLTLYFDGDDNDTEADEFWQSLKQNGKWEVVHPLYGVLFLQLISEARQDIQPVDSINYMAFSTVWMETLPDGTEVSLSQLSGEIDAQGILANIAAAQQFVDNVRRKTFAEVAAVTSSVAKVVNAVKKTIRIVTNFDVVPDSIEAIIRGINSTLSEFPPDMSALAGQVQTLIRVGVIGQDNVKGSNDTYSNFAAEIATIQPTVADTEGLNTASVQELALSAANVAFGLSAVLPGNETRSQAVESANAVLAFFKDMTNLLDETQELYRSTPIELQYFSQSQSYTESQRMAALAARFLLLSATDLKIERRFILEVPRNFIEICATEYGNIDDATLDFFIETNELKNHEIRIIPALREIVVYV